MKVRPMVGKLLDNLQITWKARWRVFVLGLVAELIMTLLLHAGVHTPAQFNVLKISQPQKSVATSHNNPQQPSSWDLVQSKLQQTPNNFHLSHDASLIPTAEAASDYDQATSYIAIDFDSGKVLAEKNASQQVPIASLTKIMSAVVTLDLVSPDQNFTVPTDAPNVQPTSIGVVPGQKMTVDELLHAAVMASANDSVQVLKEGVDQQYGAGTFVRAMNAKAQFLGLQNTHFDNPQGFDAPNNYSSASDLAVLAHYALKNYPLIAQIVQTDYQFLSESNSHKQFDLYNWNGLLDVYPGVYGVKIGNTNDAGYTTVVVSERDGKNVLAVVLGAPGVMQRDQWAADLLDTGFEKLGLLPVGVTSDQLQAKYNTWKYWG